MGGVDRNTNDQKRTDNFCSLYLAASPNIHNQISNVDFGSEFWNSLQGLHAWLTTHGTTSFETNSLLAREWNRETWRRAYDRIVEVLKESCGENFRNSFQPALEYLQRVPGNSGS